MDSITIERHPLEPFLPEGAKLLILGSFPPLHKRWSMEFFYPNFNNDFWRIVGLLFFEDKSHFIDATGKAFDRPSIVKFLTDTGIAMFDIATAVRRLKDNASDNYLEIVEPTDIVALLDRLPQCRAIAVTGQKACDTICAQLHIAQPQIGCFTTFTHGDRDLRLYRMPSTSRAYPLSLEKKAEAYKTLFANL
jgi:G:T/U-mismatch repair DNA glycosylase